MHVDCPAGQYCDDFGYCGSCSAVWDGALAHSPSDMMGIAAAEHCGPNPSDDEVGPPVGIIVGAIAAAVAFAAIGVVCCIRKKKPATVYAVSAQTQGGTNPAVVTSPQVVQVTAAAAAVATSLPGHKIAPAATIPAPGAPPMPVPQGP